MEKLKAKLFLYVEALQEYSELCNAESTKNALLQFRTFPSVAELSKFFNEYRKSDPYWSPPVADFEPPHELAASFASWRKAVGPAAYRSWLRGAEAWRRIDGGITVKAATAFRARWIREHYVAALEAIDGNPVLVTADDPQAPRYWPHGGPVGGTPAAWWQTHNPKTCVTVDETAEHLKALDTWQHVAK